MKKVGHLIPLMGIALAVLTWPAFASETATTQDQAPVMDERSTNLHKIDQFLSEEALAQKGVRKEEFLQKLGDRASDTEIATMSAQMDKVLVAQNKKDTNQGMTQDERLKEAQIRSYERTEDWWIMYRWYWIISLVLFVVIIAAA